MPHIPLLLRVADHLDGPQIGHERFYFGFFNSGRSERTRDRLSFWPHLKRCNEAGCGVGECPFVFPGWHFNHAEQPVYKDYEDPKLSTMKFFDLHKFEYQHLFVPNHQAPNRYGGKVLDKHATRFEVAANIRAFCEAIKP